MTDSPQNWGLEDELLKRFRLAVLKACRGNRTHAAWFCGIQVRTFRSHLNRYRMMGIEIPESDRSTIGIENQDNPILDRIVKHILGFTS